MAFPIFIVVLGIFQIASGTRFTLCGRDFPNTDVDNGAPDGFVQIFYAPSKDAPLEIVGVTHVNYNNRNPDWEEIYKVSDSSDNSQYLKFVVMDEDELESGDEVMGEVSVTLTRLHQQANRVLWNDIRKNGTFRGKLVVKVQEEEEEPVEPVDPAEPIESEESEESVEESEEGANDCTSVICPANTDEQYFPHPGTCYAYCQCSNGTPYEMSCGALVWDPRINNCVRNEDYHCSL